ncbi:hypothetical protein ACHAP5_010880 [Fusarium lateritium]
MALHCYIARVIDSKGGSPSLMDAKRRHRSIDESEQEMTNLTAISCARDTPFARINMAKVINVLITEQNDLSIKKIHIIGRNIQRNYLDSANEAIASKVDPLTTWNTFAGLGDIKMFVDIDSKPSATPTHRFNRSGFLMETVESAMRLKYFASFQCPWRILFALSNLKTCPDE